MATARKLLYDTHVPLNMLQKGAVAVASAVGALLDPARADLVAALGETTGEGALRSMRNRMVASDEGRKILLDRPRVTNQSVAHAWDCPPGTFGAAYAQYMGKRNFHADERPPVRFVDDEELAYVAARAREVHDFWHVLFRCPTTVLGELALKAVELTQTGMPMAALAVAGGSLRLGPEAQRRLFNEYLPWAVRAGTRSTDLMCLFYERHLQDDLEAVRAQWSLTPAPRLTKKPAYPRTL